MRKRLFGIFLILTAFVALFCVTASAAVSVKVGGSDNLTNNPAIKSGTVTFDGSTLTLDNAVIEATGVGIDLELTDLNDRLTIELVGTNVLTVHEDRFGSATGISADYDTTAGAPKATFQGKGALQVRLQEETEVEGATGIYTNKVSLEFAKEVTLDVESGDATKYSYGLLLTGTTAPSLIITDEAKVRLKSGDAKVSSALYSLEDPEIGPKILMPQDGKKEWIDDYDYYTVVDSQGNVAREVVIGNLIPVTITAPEGVDYSTTGLTFDGYAKTGSTVVITVNCPGYGANFALTGAISGSGDETSAGFVVETEPVTVTITLTPFPYEITFHANDGTEEKVTVKSTYDQEVYMADDLFLVPGKYITGYNTEADGTGEGYMLRTERKCQDNHGETVALYAQWADLPFRDVKEDDWFLGDVSYVYQRGMVIGTELDEFSPQTNITRSMIVQILYRLEGEPEVTEACPFADVPEGYYAEKAITWAAEKKIIQGYGDGNFGPEDDITREQLAAILYRYAGQYKGLDVSEADSLSKFPDADQIEDYAVAPMKWVVAVGIIQGHDTGLLAPQDMATRAEASAMLHRLGNWMK